MLLQAAPAQADVLFALYDENAADIIEVNHLAGGGAVIGLFGGTGSGQFSAIADANIGTVVAQFNTLLADLRLRGDLAT